MTPEQQALVNRFDTFIGQLQSRQQEIFAEATAGTQALVQQRPGELGPIRAALGALDALIRQLTDKLEQAWDAQIEGLFRAQGDAFWDVGIDRKEDARTALEAALEKFKADQEGNCLCAMYPAVQAAIAKTHPCSGCGAPLQLRVPYVAETIACASCGVANQLMPAPIVSTYFLNGANVFPHQATLPLRFQIDQDRARVDRLARGGAEEPFESLQRWEAQEAAYWRKYAEVKAAFLGQPVDEELVAGRIAQFREQHLSSNRTYRRGSGS